MASNSLFHTLTRHHLTSETLISALIEADRCERTLGLQEGSSAKNNRHENKGREHLSREHLWPSNIGFVLSPANEWLIQIMQDEIATNHPARIKRMSLLEQDQQRLLAGWRPSSRDLEVAPGITPDTLFITPVDANTLINLAGFVTNVPGGGPDRRRVTSLIIAFDAARFEWIRTLSRFYRLGPIRAQSANECQAE